MCRCATVFQAEYDFPVYVDNEANLAALGETYFGAARGVRHLLYVFTGVGLGGGIVLDGHLSLGATGIGSEFGHMTMDVDGLPCNCGNRGCWETLASQEALFRRVRLALAMWREQPRRPARKPDRRRASSRRPRMATRRDWPRWRRPGRYLGIGIANLVNALNPETVVLGGALSEASEFLLPAIKAAICGGALRWSAEAMRLMVAAHGADACLIGGAARVYEAILSHPLQTMLAGWTGSAVNPVGRTGRSSGRVAPCGQAAEGGEACREHPAQCRGASGDRPRAGARPIACDQALTDVVSRSHVRWDR